MTALHVPAVERRVLRAEELIATLREYRAAEVAVAKASARRRAIPAGGSRAQVTTANARWMSACEHRDRIEARLADYGVDLDWGATR